MSFIKRIATSASESRLQGLIEERLQPGADKELIDRRIWDLFGESRVVMFTDLSGFSRKVAEFGIVHFLQVILESHRVLVPCIEQHDGILIKTEGDSMLVVFRSVQKALACSIAMQRAARDYNVDRQDAEKILLCIGLGFGDVLRIGDHDVFGAEVNAASKLGEDTAGAWEILVTGAVRRAAGDMEFEPLDEAPPGADSAFRVRYEL
jgi:class 3 adenylate cyclase